MKTFFMLPGHDYTPHFFNSWSRLLVHTAQENAISGYVNRSSPQVFESRNWCIDAFLGSKKYAVSDYIMWIDTDMVFEVARYESLIDTMQKTKANILAGVAKIGHGKYNAIEHYVYSSPEDSEYINQVDRGIVKVDMAGFGFVLMKTEVIGTMLKNNRLLFYNKINKDKNGKTYILSEDFTFCDDARKCGFDIYADTGCVVGHEKSVIL